MSAKASEENVSVGMCLDCDWLSQPYAEGHEAEQAVDEHNKENHDDE